MKIRYCKCEHGDNKHDAEGCHAVDIEAFDTKYPRRHECPCEGFEDINED